METEEFDRVFKLASRFCRDFTQKHILETLPSRINFNFALALRKENVATPTKMLPFAGNLYQAKSLVGLSFIQARNFLFKDFQTPTWIDLYIGGFDDKTTYIEVTYCEEFTDDPSKLFNQKGGLPPFHVIGPTVPQGWQSLEKDGQFNFIPFS